MRHLPSLVLCLGITGLSSATASGLFNEFENDDFLQYIQTKEEINAVADVSLNAKTSSIKTVDNQIEKISPETAIHQVIIEQIKQAKSEISVSGAQQLLNQDARDTEKEAVKETNIPEVAKETTKEISVPVIAQETALETAIAANQQAIIDDEAYNQGIIGEQKETPAATDTLASDTESETIKQGTVALTLEEALANLPQQQINVAQTSNNSDPSQSTLQMLKDCKFLVSHYPPLATASQTKHASSIFVDLIKKIHANYQQNVNEEQFENVPFARALFLMQGIQKNILLGMVKTKSIEDNYKWIGPVGQTKVVIYTLNDKPLKKQLESANIGVLHKSAAREHLLDNGFFRYRLQPSLSVDSLVKKLQAARIDAIAVSSQSVSRAALEETYNIQLSEVKDFENIPVYFAMSRWTDEAFVNGLQTLIEQTQSNTAEETL